MNCKKIQELLITDYLDNQLDLQQSKAVEDHLRSCQACAECASMVKKSALDPFKDTERLQVPEYLWWKIKDEIKREEAPRPVFGFLDNIIRGIRTPRPTFALSTVAALAITLFFIIKISTPVQSPQPLQLAALSLEEHIDYFTNGNDLQELSSLGTDIEKYFL